MFLKPTSIYHICVLCIIIYVIIFVYNNRNLLGGEMV